MAARVGPSPVQFAQEAWSELKKVTWPSSETVVRLTIIVIVISALIAGYIFGFDNLFTWAITERFTKASPTPAP